MASAVAAPVDALDRKVFDWLSAQMGEVIEFTRHPRWRPGWDVVVLHDGKPLPLYVRGPRGDSYVSPVDMYQEAAIHDVLLENGIPVPRVHGMIEDPLSIVMERLPGGINSGTIADETARQRVRDEFIDIVARIHALPVDAFARANLAVPQTPEETALSLYSASEAIYRRNIGRPWPLMSFIARWLRRNVPHDRARTTFVNYDGGQFLFDGDRVSGLIDFEVSCLGDPAAELAGMRLRDTTEPLGDLSAMMDRYEALTGDRLSKQLIEFHTAGFCGVNGFLMWPLAFNPAPEQDYTAYMIYSVVVTRWSIHAIAEYMGLELTDPAEPKPHPIAFPAAGQHLVRAIEALPGANPSEAYNRDACSALARYLSRWNDYGADITAQNLADIAAIIGEPVDDWDAAQAKLEAFVDQAGPDEDARLVQHFHNWLMRQTFLIEGCGVASFMARFELQHIPER